jgi:hypothetical protein
MTNYTDEEIEQIVLINLVCSLFSILGSLFIFFVFIVHKKIRKLPYRLIIYLTISDLGTAIAFCLPITNSVLCNIQGCLLSYFMLSSIFWCAILSHAMVKVIKYNFDLQKYEKRYILFGFGLPFLSLAVLADIRSYRMTYGFCWIYSDHKSQNSWTREIVYRVLTYYCPLGIIQIYIFYLYFIIKRHFYVNSGLSTFHDDLKRKIIVKMRLYPVVLFICQIPCVALRITAIWNIPAWYFAAIAGAGLSINGMVNAMVYGVTQDVRNKMKKIFKKSQKSGILQELDCSTN